VFVMQHDTGTKTCIGQPDTEQHCTVFCHCRQVHFSTSIKAIFIRM